MLTENFGGAGFPHQKHCCSQSNGFHLAKFRDEHTKTFKRPASCTSPAKNDMAGWEMHSDFPLQCETTGESSLPIWLQKPPNKPNLSFLTVPQGKGPRVWPDLLLGLLVPLLVGIPRRPALFSTTGFWFQPLLHLFTELKWTFGPFRNFSEQ